MNKRIILIIAAAASLGGSLHAQTVTSFKSKNGHEVLPQEGDWALGISATTFLGYAGNLLNGNTANASPAINNANGATANAIGNIGGVALYGKYMVSPDMAYRVRFQANANSVTMRNYVLESNVTPDPLAPEFVQDKQVRNTSAFLIGGGIEKRRGAGRLQGVYGGEVILGFQSESREITYGNEMNETFTAPLSTNFNATSIGGTSAAGTRLVKESIGSQFFAGARGFIGAEYFFAPKMSIGAEIGYTLGFQTNGKGESTVETFDTQSFASKKITTKTLRNNGLSSFGIGLDNINAGINLMLYF
jgi:hypothetical protein